MSSDYRYRQHQKDSAYENAYAEWIATLSPEERAKLGNMGLDKPLMPDRPASNCGLEGDVADTPLASERPDIAEAMDRVPEPAGEVNTEALWDALRRLLGEILTAPNRSLTVECLAVVSGLSYTGDSMSEIAHRHRVTRAAVSKRCVELTEKLDLMPSRAMRTLTARKAYRGAQIKRRTSLEK